MEIDLSSRVKLRAGYNYGRNPIPAQNLNPLLAVIGERHLTAGLVHKLSDGWTLAYGMEYQWGDKVVYTNPALPFGPNAEARSKFPAFDVMLSRRW
jgi:long-chain fatty acid transport protein